MSRDVQEKMYRRCARQEIFLVQNLIGGADDGLWKGEWGPQRSIQYVVRHPTSPRSTNVLGGGWLFPCAGPKYVGLMSPLVLPLTCPRYGCEFDSGIRGFAHVTRRGCARRVSDARFNIGPWNRPITVFEHSAHPFDLSETRWGDTL